MARRDKGHASVSLCDRPGINRRTLLRLGGSFFVRWCVRRKRTRPSRRPGDAFNTPMDVGGDWGGSFRPRRSPFSNACARFACRVFNSCRTGNRTQSTSTIIPRGRPPSGSTSTIRAPPGSSSISARATGASSLTSSVMNWVTSCATAGVRHRNLNRHRNGSRNRWWRHSRSAASGVWPRAGARTRLSPVTTPSHSAIRRYRQNAIDNYSKSVDRASYTDLADWFQKSRVALERPGTGLHSDRGPCDPCNPG